MIVLYSFRFVYSLLTAKLVRNMERGGNLEGTWKGNWGLTKLVLSIGAATYNTEIYVDMIYVIIHTYIWN